MPTPIYEMIMRKAEAGELCAPPELEHQVWDPTPWIIDVFTGGYNDHGDTERKIREYCDEHIGPESCPIHDRPGKWHRGGATVNGWTWIGFDTEQHMHDFMVAWPDNVRQPNPPDHRPEGSGG